MTLGDVAQVLRAGGRIRRSMVGYWLVKEDGKKRPLPAALFKQLTMTGNLQRSYDRRAKGPEWIWLPDVPITKLPNPAPSCGGRSGG